MTLGPDFMIIGAMKCATSTLHLQLARQPGIFMSTPKEPNFFSDEESYARGIDWYRGLFAAAPLGAIRGESSTHYTKLPTYPRTLERMLKHGLAPRLIYIMRDPIDRLTSQYIHEWTESTISGSLERAVWTTPRLIDYGRYAMQLEPWMEAFGRDRILLVYFERIKVEPHRQLERICRFLGYRGDPAWDHSVGRDNVSSERLRESPIRDAVVNAPILSHIRRGLIPKSVRNRIKRHWQVPDRPTLGLETLQRLRAIYDEDLAKLGGWTGMRLTASSFSEIACSADPDWESLHPAAGEGAESHVG